MCGSLVAMASPLAAQTVLPGTIQAEDFNGGAAGTAYYDTTAGNSGGQYRATDVDIETTSDTGGGHNVGWVFAGEWLRYSVTIGAAGVYDIEVRVASPSAGGSFHIEVDGVDRTGALNIPNTGAWQSWATIRRTGVSLAAGQQTWRVVMDTNGAIGAVGNINYIRVTGSSTPSNPTPYTGTPAALPGTVQAEDFDNGGEGVAYHDSTNANDGGQYRTTGVDLEWSTDADGAYNVGWAFAGEWLTYTVNVASAGTYAVEVRVASNGNGGTFHIEVNGVDRTGPFTVPNTGGWQTWTTLRKTGLSLGAGQQRWRLVMDTNGATTAVGNINYIRVTPSASSGPTPFTGVPVSLPGTLQIEAFDNGGEGVAYHDLSTENSGGEYRTTAVDIEPTADTGGGYNVGWAFAGEWLTYTVNVGTAGLYDIEARVASNGTGGTFHIDVNGVDRTGVFSVPNTGGWQTWTTIRKTGLSLNAGPQVWSLVMDTNGPTTAVGNFNYLRLISAGGNPPPPPPSATTVVFNASTDHTTNVTSYTVRVYRATDPVTATPLATKNLGKPTPVNNEISADISDIMVPLPSGSYYAVVQAFGPGGSSMSTPSASFAK